MAGNPRRTQILAIAGFAVIVVAVLIAVSVGGSDSDSDGSVEESGTAAADLFDGIPQSGTVVGDPDAPAVMTEFGDLQCPFCAEFSTEVLPTLVEDYVRPGRLQLDLQALTFIGPDSLAAAELAEAAGMQDRLWQFTDVFYANQGTENTGYVTEEFLTEIASAVSGLDVDQALADRDSPEVKVALTEARDAAAEAGFDSTPSFLIAVDGEDPRPLEVSSLDPEEFAAALDAALGNSG
jgi:protein-disulfide isomerase